MFKNIFDSGILYPLPDGAYCTLPAVCIWYPEPWPGKRSRKHIRNTKTVTNSVEASLHLTPHVFITHDHVVLAKNL